MLSHLHCHGRTKYVPGPILSALHFLCHSFLKTPLWCWINQILKMISWESKWLTCTWSLHMAEPRSAPKTIWLPSCWSSHWFSCLPIITFHTELKLLGGYTVLENLKKKNLHLFSPPLIVHFFFMCLFTQHWILILHRHWAYNCSLVLLELIFWWRKQIWIPKPHI